MDGSPSEWLRIGEYPAVGLAEARKLTGTYRYQVDIERRNPAAERRMPEPPPEPVTPVMTFATFVPVYLAFAKGKKRTWADDAAKIEKHLLPAWGPLPLRSLTRTHVHELLDGLVAKGLTIGVNRIQALISRIFTVALDRSLIDAHPAARLIKRFSEEASTRVLSDDEIRALWTGSDRFPGAAAGRDPAAGPPRAARRRDGRYAVERDRPRCGSLVPAAAPNKEQTRARRDAATDGPRPAPEAARGSLVCRARVFPDLTLTSVEHKALGVLHGGVYEWKDLRRTVATRLATLGFNETVIGRTLNHARYTVTAKHYNQHAYVEETRRALEAWDRDLTAILEPGQVKARKVLRHQPRRKR